MAGEYVGVSIRATRIRVDDDKLYQKGSAPYIAAERFGRQAVRYVQDALIQEGLIEDGDLYNSIDYEVFRSGKGLSVAVFSDEKHALYTNFGTDGPITAGGKLMPVKIKGGPLLFLRSVRGQAAKGYFEQALRRTASGDWY